MRFQRLTVPFFDQPAQLLEEVSRDFCVHGGGIGGGHGGEGKSEPMDHVEMLHKHGGLLVEERPQVVEEKLL